MTDEKIVAFDIRDIRSLQQTTDDIMAVLHLHIDNAAADATGNFVGVQYISVFHAQQIYRVTATGDYRAVNWNTGQDNTNERATVNECHADDPDQRWWPGWEHPDNEGDNVVLEFGRALRGRGFITDHILDGFYDPATFPVSAANGGDQYGFTYDTARARERTGSFLPSGDGLFNDAADFSGFMGNVYQTAPPDPGNQQWGGGDPIKL